MTDIADRDCWTDDEYREILGFVDRYLWLFVQQNAGIHRPKQVACNLTQLGYAEVRLLQRVHFLLSKTVQACVKESVPRLLKHVAQSTERLTTDTWGAMQGSPDWSQTVKRRSSLGFHVMPVFVTRKATRTCDLAEMQALKYLLTLIVRMCVDVLGYAPEEGEDEAYSQGDRRWRNEIRPLYYLAKASLKNVYMHSISLPNKVTDLMLQRVRCARNTEFRTVYESLLLYRKLFVQEDQQVLQDCFTQSVLMPMSRDTLYETYILFLTMEALAQLGWQRGHLRLIGYGDGAVVEFRFGSQALNVFYQTLPAAFDENSLYTSLMRRYTIDARMRRPDLILEFGRSDFRLVEVKRTRNKRYIADSIYKVLGYLRDFERCFESSQLPHAILVVWSEVESGESADDVLVICNHHGYPRYLEDRATGGVGRLSSQH